MTKSTQRGLIGTANASQFRSDNSQVNLILGRRALEQSTDQTHQPESTKATPREHVGVYHSVILLTLEALRPSFISFLCILSKATHILSPPPSSTSTSHPFHSVPTGSNKALSCTYAVVELLTTIHKFSPFCILEASHVRISILSLTLSVSFALSSPSSLG